MPAHLGPAPEPSGRHDASRVAKSKEQGPPRRGVAGLATHRSIQTDSPKNHQLLEAPVLAEREVSRQGRSIRFRVATRKEGHHRRTEAAAMVGTHQAQSSPRRRRRTRRMTHRPSMRRAKMLLVATCGAIHPAEVTAVRFMMRATRNTGATWSPGPMPSTHGPSAVDAIERWLAACWHVPWASMSMGSSVVGEVLSALTTPHVGTRGRSIVLKRPAAQRSPRKDLETLMEARYVKKERSMTGTTVQAEPGSGTRVRRQT